MTRVKTGQLSGAIARTAAGRAVNRLGVQPRVLWDSHARGTRRTDVLGRSRAVPGTGRPAAVAVEAPTPARHTGRTAVQNPPVQ